jgi:hypothetical protein
VAHGSLRPMRSDPFQEADRDLAEDALRELVAEIAADDYRSLGGPLVHNTAYLKAVALLQTLDALQRRV